MDAALDAAAVSAAAGWSIPIGAPVYDATGRKLGVVVDADAGSLVVEHGLVFLHRFEVALGDVERYEDGKLFLKPEPSPGRRGR